MSMKFSGGVLLLPQQPTTLYRTEFSRRKLAHHNGSVFVVVFLG